MRRVLLRLAGLVGLLSVPVVGAAAAFVAAPLPPGLTAYEPVTSLRVLDREGGLLRELRSRADGRSTPLRSVELSPVVRAAFLAAEDRSFETHWGLSPGAIVRAAWQNLRARRVVAGGSTITQQLARLLVPRPRTLAGKLQEALWALRLEAHLSKEELLTQYCNRVPFGNSAFGLEAGAQLYFGKRAVHLSLAQAAVLAAIPRGPTAYNPYRAPQRLEARRQWVLDRVQAGALWPGDEVAQARSEALDFTPFRAAFRAPHFVEYVLTQLVPLGLDGAAVVQTSLDPMLQAMVEAQVAEEVGRLGDRRVGNAAALVVDNSRGEVLAYQGSADFFVAGSLGQNDGVQMHRQPGSALKPFLYAEAFRRGYTPSTVLADLPTAFGAGAGTGAYAPKNYDRRLHGPVRAREALSSSFNVPAVRLASALGVQPLLDALRRAGFESLRESAEHYGLGLALGDGEVTLWEGARAYAGLARGGVLEPLRPVLRAWAADGTELPVSAGLPPRRFADETAVALVTHVLADNAARARAFGLDNALRLPFPAAAKTGTSKGYSDNWTLGYTRERTVAVWAGNFDGTPMVQVSGITGAGPIYRRVMTGAMEGVSARPLIDTSRLQRARICPLSGALAGPQCPAAMEELYRRGTVPARACAVHGPMSAELPPELQRRCLALAAAEGRLADLGLDYYDWARNEGLAREPWLASLCLGARPVTSTGSAQAGVEAVHILHPASGDEFLLLSDLPLADQAIPLRVRAPPSVGALAVLVDGVRRATLLPPYTGQLAATRGTHTLALRSSDGEVLAEVRYVVREERRM